MFETPHKKNGILQLFQTCLKNDLDEFNAKYEIYYVHLLSTNISVGTRYYIII